jgi:hypothetical protein
MRGFRRAMAGLHLGVAPLLFVGMLSPSRNIELTTGDMIAALPTPLPRQAIVVNTPVELLNMYAPAIGEQVALPAFDVFSWLAR